MPIQMTNFHHSVFIYLPNDDTAIPNPFAEPTSSGSTELFSKTLTARKHAAINTLFSNTSNIMYVQNKYL